MTNVVELVFFFYCDNEIPVAEAAITARAIGKLAGVIDRAAGNEEL